MLAFRHIAAISFRAMALIVLSAALSGQARWPLAANANAASGILSHLRAGKPVRGRLAGGESHAYGITLNAGQYAHIVIEPPGFATTLRLRAPNDEATLVELNLPEDERRPEPLSWVAETSGEYTLEVAAAVKTGSPDPYEIRLDELRGSVPSDAKRISAQQLFEQGRALNLKHELQQALETWAQALSIFHEINDRDREGAVLNAMASASAGQSRYEIAASYYEQALPIFHDTGDKHGQEEALNGLGNACFRRSIKDKATGYYEQALSISRRIKDQHGEGEALNGLGNISISASQNGQALAYYKQALAVWRRLKYAKGEARALANTASVYSYWSRYDEAIGIYKQALKLFREAQDRRLEGLTLSSIGNSYDSLGHYNQGINYEEQALQIFREIGDRSNEAYALVGLGLAFFNQSQYQKAIAYYQQALPIFREFKDKLEEGTTLDNLGITYGNLGEHETAIAHYEEALERLHETSDRLETSLTLDNLGWAYWNLHQYEKAIAYYEQALSIRRETNDRQGEASTLTNLGATYTSLGDYSKSVRYLEQARTIHREVKDLKEEAWNLTCLGTAYCFLGDYPKGIGYGEQALAMSREIKDPGTENDALQQLMQSWKSSGNRRLAIFYGKQAVNTIQSIRAGITGLGMNMQRSFLVSNDKAYHELADLLISEGRLAEAEQVLNLLKEEEYFDFLRRAPEEGASASRKADLTEEEAMWEARYQAVAGRIVAIGTERGELLAKGARTPEQVRQLDRITQDLTAANKAFEKFLADLTAQFSAKPESSVRIDQLLNSRSIMEDLRELPSGTVAIYTLVGEDKYRAILVTPDVQKAYEYPIQAAALNRKVLEFREAVQNPNVDPRPLAQDLYDILLGGLADDLLQAKAQTLMWSLDGSLRYLPLAALFDGKSYLMEKYGVAVFTPASNARLKDHPDIHWTAAGFGVTKEYEGAPSLPSVASELTGIIADEPGKGGVLQGEIRLDEEFTAETMRLTLLKRYPVVHIASHFQFQPGNETRSYLLLGDGSHLSLAELKSLPNLFGGVQLLTLSACNTGVGGSSADGKEVEGFGVLAQNEGAKAVLASLWPVADESTSLLMQEFYRIRESTPGITKLEALRQTQIAFLQGKVKSQHGPTTGRGLLVNQKEAPAFPLNPEAPYAHPYYWAAFFLMGNWM